MARVLVVDDDPHIREVVTFALENAGHDTDVACDGAEALEVFATYEPDLVVLDVMMPELDGIEVCRRLRAEHATPIFFLSSRGEELDRVLGLEMGADDYITKPFSPRELVARVKSMLRRVDLEKAPSADVEIIEVGELLIDIEAMNVAWDGTEVDLTPTEFNLIKTLARRPTKVFEREELMRGCYDTTTYVSDRTIDSHVRHIREKFEPTGHQPIETVHGVGYRLSKA